MRSCHLFPLVSALAVVMLQQNALLLPWQLWGWQKSVAGGLLFVFPPNSTDLCLLICMKGLHLSGGINTTSKEKKIQSGALKHNTHMHTQLVWEQLNGSLFFNAPVIEFWWNFVGYLLMLATRAAACTRCWHVRNFCPFIHCLYYKRFSHHSLCSYWTNDVH